MRCGGKQFLSPGNMAAKNKAVLEGEFIMGKSSSRFLRSGSAAALALYAASALRSEEHTSELQSLMRISYAVFCLKKKNQSSPSTRYNLRSTSSRQQPSNNHQRQHRRAPQSTNTSCIH